jgi:hypothetical protein
MVLRMNSNYSLNSINHLVFVMEKCIFFYVGTEAVNIIYDKLQLQRVK